MYNPKQKKIPGLKRHIHYDELVNDYVNDKEFFKGVFDDKWSVENKDIHTVNFEQELLKDAV